MTSDLSRNFPKSCVDGVSRRELLRRSGGGFGMLALLDMFVSDDVLADSPREPTTARSPHFPATAKGVISIFLYGGPSQMDLFDPKPELRKRDGQRMPASESLDVFFGNPGPLMASPFRFARHGESGQWVSELLPHTAKVVDDLAIIRSMQADSNNHAPALFQLNTGALRPGSPSLGSWAIYGLGSVNRHLPGFVVLSDSRGGPIGGPANWGSGYLPASFQGITLRGEGAPILDLAPPTDAARRSQRAKLELLDALNRAHLKAHPGEEALTARIASYELAFRMQAEAPDAVDLANESVETQSLYGLDDPVTAPFGRRLLMARRLIERGVRFVQVYSGGGGGFRDNWDAHDDLVTNHRRRCAETDRPVAGLLADLKRRGLLDETLVLWSGEFGRMPVSQSKIGRDHNPHGFTAWMAGGGVRGGVSLGATDDLGYRAVENPVHVRDWHATILHLLGIDHTRLTYRHAGRDARLTDIGGRPITPVIGRTAHG